MASQKAEDVFEAMIYVEEEDGWSFDDYDDYQARCEHDNSKDWCSEECACGHECQTHTGFNGECRAGTKRCQCGGFVSRASLGR